MEAKSSFVFSAFEGYSLLRLCPGDFFIAIFLSFRFKLRGPKHIIFYDLPQYPHFYSEMCNMLEDPGRITAISTDMLTCTVIYSRFDALKLGEVVGTSRAERMINTEKTVHMLVSGDTSWGMNREHYWLSGDSGWNLLSGDRNWVWNVWMNICMRMEKNGSQVWNVWLNHVWGWKKCSLSVLYCVRECCQSSGHICAQSPRKKCRFKLWGCPAGPQGHLRRG